MASYRIPKEKEPEAATSAAAAHAAAGINPDGSAPATAPGAAGSAGGGAMANTAVPTASGSGLTWTAPAHWQSKAASAMRKATFTVPGEGGASAELAVTAFPGDVGGEVANVNRWRGQIQLPPLSDADVGAAIMRLEANGLKIAVVDMVNPAAATPTRVLGAWIPHQGSTWFFKLSGPDSVVAKEKNTFIQFLNTIKAPTP
ncbi:MAG: hypothetical protein Q7S40_30800 [Opitutaceae bacterium]|nr:hypothetical protein [Opitutaceae bacterium]